MELYRKQTEQTIDRVRELMQQLPEQERQVLEMRFDDGWPARRIAEELELSGQREVYTIVTRATRTLRRLLGPMGSILAVAIILGIIPLVPSNPPGIETESGIVPDSIQKPTALSPRELGE